MGKLSDAMDRAGNRAIVLGLLGVIWILFGLSTATGARARVGMYDEYLPDPLRALPWLLAGAGCLTAAAVRRFDDEGWALAIVPPVASIAVRVVTWLGHWPFGTPVPRGLLIGVLLYVVAGVLVFFCARGLDRPPRALLADEDRP